MRKVKGRVTAIVLLLAAGCGGDEPPGAGERTPNRTDEIGLRVERSGRLSHLAVEARGRAIEPPVVRNCTSVGAKAGVVAPPCRRSRSPAIPPRLGVLSGDPVLVTTGQPAATVTLLHKGEDDARPIALDAEPVDDERQRWRVRMPEWEAGYRDFEISVSPMRTDSGSLGFGFAASFPPPSER